MIPIGFRNANKILNRPADMTAVECTSIEVYADEHVVISKWQFTEEELEEIKANGGKVFLGVRGSTMPPVFLTSIDPWGKGKEFEK